jgi:hypothetical protein
MFISFDDIFALPCQLISLETSDAYGMQRMAAVPIARPDVSGMMPWE